MSITCKFVYGEDAESEHWLYCERYHYPYIRVVQYNDKYEQIFYDITNLSYDFQLVSDKVRGIYQAYMQFFTVPMIDVIECFDQPYFFYFYVKKGHGEFVAEQLFEFLLKE